MSERYENYIKCVKQLYALSVDDKIHEDSFLQEQMVRDWLALSQEERKAADDFVIKLNTTVQRVEK